MQSRLSAYLGESEYSASLRSYQQEVYNSNEDSWRNATHLLISHRKPSSCGLSSSVNRYTAILRASLAVRQAGLSFFSKSTGASSSLPSSSSSSSGFCAPYDRRQPPYPIGNQSLQRADQNLSPHPLWVLPNFLFLWSCSNSIGVTLTFGRVTRSGAGATVGSSSPLLRSWKLARSGEGLQAIMQAILEGRRRLEPILQILIRTSREPRRRPQAPPSSCTCGWHYAEARL